MPRWRWGATFAATIVLMGAGTGCAARVANGFAASPTEAVSSGPAMGAPAPGWEHVLVTGTVRYDEGSSRLTLPDGTHTVGLTSQTEAGLSRMDGMTVTVDGWLAPKGLTVGDHRDVRVTSVIVIAVGDVPVLDGRLAVSPRGYTLCLPNGTAVPLLHPTARLGDLRGARVWIAPGPGGTVTAFGMLEAPR